MAPAAQWEKRTPAPNAAGERSVPFIKKLPRAGEISYILAGTRLHTVLAGPETAVFSERESAREGERSRQVPIPIKVHFSLLFQGMEPLVNNFLKLLSDF